MKEAWRKESWKDGRRGKGDIKLPGDIAQEKDDVKGRKREGRKKGRGTELESEGVSDGEDIED